MPPAIPTFFCKKALKKLQRAECGCVAALLKFNGNTELRACAFRAGIRLWRAALPAAARRRAHKKTPWFYHGEYWFNLIS